jgi:adenine phosphoribosyltransferase
MERLVKGTGGVIVGNMAILAEGDAIGRDDIIYLEKLPLFTPDGSPIES